MSSTFASATLKPVFADSVHGPHGLLGGITAADVAIKDLGKCLLPSPVAHHLGEGAMTFVGAADKVLVDDSLLRMSSYTGRLDALPAFEVAGPRNKIMFDPRTVRAAIVTCGGLCPGLNNVIRGLVCELGHGYGVKRIFGFRYGYEGIIARFGHDPMPLSPDSVAHIHHQGGTILGSSRGSQDATEVVDNLEATGINILFVVGGDGTIRAAMQFAAEIEQRGVKISVVGVPKTIDNDIHFIDRSFGFESAYSAAVDVIRSARVEAMGARNGIGLVKLMGRHSGFVACQAALASTDVDLVLIPEVPALLEGEPGVLAYLQKVLDRKGNAVVVVAEGAAQELIADDAEGERTDKSGNVKLKDVGVFLRDRVTQHFKRSGREVTLKYIDPSYAIRSVPATPSDSVYCWNMARNAVHAAMAGNTEMLIGRWHGRFVHVPMALATRSRKQVESNSDLWMSVIESTGQPTSFA
ncbi:MAG: diphosphate--fructose-6-phosphate 1-phosphotransferase [Proteobacteria bacterium]|nr:MAG: diphosphate--fructose-6-phosphate 1-phosphotransferase [Pseudomonadota bacterium]